jgi:hypothetical protein
VKNKLSRYLFAFALCIINRVSAASSDRTVLLEFEHTPFPFNENLTAQTLASSTQAPAFFDVHENGRRGHTSSRGGVYWEDTTYKDNRVLLALSPYFKIKQRPIIVVYFHGNQSTLERDVIERQKIPEQLANSKINAFLVAPQFAVDAQDSSVGHFADEGFFAKFLDEVAERAASWKHNEKYKTLKNAKVVLVAYSGGYQAAAYAIERGGAQERIAGVILMDALYGHEDKFADWLQANKEHSFFFSCYTESARANNEDLEHQLSSRKLQVNTGVPSTLTSGTINFLSLPGDTLHNDLLTRAWVDDPLTDLMRRIAISNRPR